MTSFCYNRCHKVLISQSVQLCCAMPHKQHTAPDGNSVWCNPMLLQLQSDSHSRNRVDQQTSKGWRSQHWTQNSLRTEQNPTRNLPTSDTSPLLKTSSSRQSN
jgi:hypothetical protein